MAQHSPDVPTAAGPVAADPVAGADPVRIAESVPDPELPFLTLGDLGVIRGAQTDPDGALRVAVTPTYLGCPATEVIRDDVRAALVAAGWPQVVIETRLDPPWTPERITARGREKLAEQGIAPPPVRGAATGPVFVQLTSPPPRASAGETAPAGAEVPCPRCGAHATRQLSAFGSTPCQELRRCTACGEPFPAIKPGRTAGAGR